MYPGIADLLKSGLFHWAGDASAFEGGGNSSFIEIVCSPNNPDGAIRHAVLGTQGGKRVHDLAYYWPQYTPMRGLADEDIMLFTVSKATGHAGTRIGWALVRDADIARRMVKFIEMNSIGVSKDSQIRAARILQVISDGYELPDSKGPGRLFHFSRRLLSDRWQRLRQAVKESGRFSLPQFPLEFCEFTQEHAETYPGMHKKLITVNFSFFPISCRIYNSHQMEKKLRKKKSPNKELYCFCLFVWCSICVAEV